MTSFVANTDRRRFLKTGAAVTALSGLLPAVSHAAAPAPILKTALDAFADEIIRLSPENATSLGMDKGVYADCKSKLSDLSVAGDKAWADQLKSMRKRLNTINRTTLTNEDALRYDTVLYAVDRGLTGASFPYGHGAAAGLYGGAAPYVVTQQDGAVVGVPEFLNSQHLINTADDAEAYLSRVSGFAKQLDQENERIAADAAIGVVPPAFIAANALGQLKGFRGTATAEQGLVTSLATRAQKAGIAGDWAAKCAKIVESEVYPALDRQIAAYTKATANAPTTAGVHRLPRGETYYQWGLKLGTTTNMTAAEVHKIGLEQNAALKARMDELLKKQGLTQGSVGERVQALNKDPRFLYADNDAGRAEIIAYLDECISKVRAIMPKLSKLGLKADIQVKRVPVDIQDGAPLGYMNFASLDGSRPSIYYINLKSTSLWPKYQLPTLTAHEGIPGHTWQGAYLAEHHDEIPLLSSLMGYNAFIEGWALYAEQLVQEQGLYAADPFAEIGYLQAQQFRACRLVVDTGLHALKWTREQSVQFLTSETGKGVGAMTSETDRYCVAPGQACGYKMGHNEILRLRAKAKTALGAKFDLADFNDTVVRTGGVPLSLLSLAVDSYVKSALKA